MSRGKSHHKNNVPKIATWIDNVPNYLIHLQYFFHYMKVMIVVLGLLLLILFFYFIFLPFINSLHPNPQNTHINTPKKGGPEDANIFSSRL